MIKGLIGSLISAAVFFTAGGMSVAIFGTNPSFLGSSTREFAGFTRDFETLRLDAFGDGEWTFECYPEIALDLSGTKAQIVPVTGNEITLSVKSDGVSVGTGGVTVKAAVDTEERCLGIAVKQSGFFIMNATTTTVKIGLPETDYDRFELSIGSGSVTADNINALENDITIGSGKLMFSQTAEFTADRFAIDMGSGSAEAVNIAARNMELDISSGSVIMDTSETEHFTIEMGSGKFEVSGLGGAGSIDVSSGRGIARFADADSIDGSKFNLSSGSLTVYFPRNVEAEINADVGSGSIVVDCAGVNKKLRSYDMVTLNGGGAQIFAEVSSGKMSILDAHGGTAAQVTIVDQGHNEYAEYAIQFADIIPKDTAVTFIHEQ